MQGKIRNENEEWETVELVAGTVIQRYEHRVNNKNGIPVVQFRAVRVSPGYGQDNARFKYWALGGCRTKFYCIKRFELGVAILEPCEPFLGEMVEKGRSILYVPPATGKRYASIVVSPRKPDVATNSAQIMAPKPQRRAEDVPDTAEPSESDDWWE